MLTQKRPNRFATRSFLLFNFDFDSKLVADQRECVDSDVIFTLFDTADVLEGDASLLCEIPERYIFILSGSLDLIADNTPTPIDYFFSVGIHLINSSNIRR